jgi:hypothetical protein
MEEQGNGVEDYMGEKEGEKRHGTLYSYDTRVPTERKLQSTHQKMFSMYEEDRKGNVMVKTYPMDKYIGVDVVQKGVKDGQEEEVKKEMILQMEHAAHLSTSPPRVYWITQYRPV